MNFDDFFILLGIFILVGLAAFRILTIGGFIPCDKLMWISTKDIPAKCIIIKN